MISDLNTVISLLPYSTRAKWQDFFERVVVDMGQVLYEAGASVDVLYFPLTAIISWVHVLANGSSTEIAITGREGVVGLHSLMSSEPSQNKAIVQKAGVALRISKDVMLEEFKNNPAVQKILFSYTRTLMTQLSQGAVCHQHHNLEQQLCRMLLLTLDRQDGQVILLTHELIAQLLGVRREAVSHAAYRLMQENTLRYSRGRIHVLDRAALEAKACECYAVISAEYGRFKKLKFETQQAAV